MIRRRFVLAACLLFLPSLAGAAREYSVDLKVESGSIGATLSLPNGACPCPAVLLIAGSGPTDRDGNSSSGLRTDTYKQLAATLAEAGFASLRYDKRGIGASADAERDEASLRFDTLVADAHAWLDWLARDGRFTILTVAGHSEGALVGMLAIENSPANAFVSLAGPAAGGAQLLRRQLAGRLTPAQLAQHEQILSRLEQGRPYADVPSEWRPLYRASVQPYLMSWFRRSPVEVISRLRVPVLIVQGDKDKQVSVEDATALRQAHPDAELSIVPGMTHTLKHIESDKAQIASYTDPSLPLSPRLKEELVEFLRRVSAR